MSNRTPPVPITLDSSVDRVFPTLKQPQMDRVALHGRVRSVVPGEVLSDVGDKHVHVFVVSKGEIEIVQPSDGIENPVAWFRPGQFTGEITMLSGRRALLRVRAKVHGEVIELDRDNLMALVQTDGELSELFMRAFILRRVELVARGF